MKVTRMKTNNKNNKQHAYASLVLPDKTRASRKVVIDRTNKIHVYQGKDSVVDGDISTDVVHESLDDFAKKGKQTILTYHEQLIKDAIPKGQDIYLTACYVWAYFLKYGVPHLDTSPQATQSGKVSKVLSRTYTIIAISLPEVHIPNQASACLRILSDAAKDGKVTEDVARAAIAQRAPELKTRQEPWRIFQFYRPQLIKLGHLKHD